MTAQFCFCHILTILCQVSANYCQTMAVWFMDQKPWLETIDVIHAEPKIIHPTGKYLTPYFTMRTCIPWRDLPDRYGPWQTVFSATVALDIC